MKSLPIIVAGLMGATGVALAALAAHARPGAGLDSASHLLLFHAAAVMAATSLADNGRLCSWPAAFAKAGWIIGAVLFAGDITLRAFTAHRLFPMAAPSGGTILIVAWLALSVSSLCATRR